MGLRRTKYIFCCISFTKTLFLSGFIDRTYVAMLLENPKTGTLGIVYESAISEKTVPIFFFAKKKCSKMKLHDLYIDGKKKCQSFARHGSENGRKSHILYTSDFNWLFQGEIYPLARIANSYYTAVKNDVRYVNKAAIAVF